MNHLLYSAGADKTVQIHDINVSLGQRCTEFKTVTVTFFNISFITVLRFFPQYGKVLKYAIPSKLVRMIYSSFDCAEYRTL